MTAFSALASSTNVRSAVESAAGIWMKTWGRVDPEGASRQLLHLFSRTTRGTPSKKSREALEKGTPFSVEGPVGPVRGWTFGEGPVVYLVHGWNGRGSQLTGYIEPLVALGYQVVAFDGPGHGDSAGDYSHVGLLTGGLAAVAGRFGPAAGVVAHSLGAAATGVAIDQGHLVADRLVFVAPSARPASFVRDFVRRAVGDDDIERQVLERFEKEVGLSLHQVELPHLGLSQPTLVVHCHDDDEIPYAVAQELGETWPGVSLWPTYGLGHRRILRDPQVTHAGVRFLARGELPEAPWGCRCGEGALGSCERCEVERELFEPGLRAA